jgi:hypothetical protein
LINGKGTPESLDPAPRYRKLPAPTLLVVLPRRAALAEEHGWVALSFSRDRAGGTDLAPPKTA